MGLLGSANRVLPHALIWVNSRDESDFRFCLILDSRRHRESVPWISRPV